jgi:very-short-patch-repair endonuclease
MAAVLACGEGAVLSHTSAAELWGIRRRVRRLSETGRRGERAAVHVTVPSTAGKRRQRGIVLHHSTTLISRHCTRHDAIPVTTPARTLCDLRPLLSPAQLTAAVREAEFLRLPIGDAPGRDGASKEWPRTRSELEARLMALVRRHRLPRPEANVTTDRYEVDFLWREQRLIVEVDGWDSHRSRSAFEEDRARDARLKVLGYDVIRFTWRQVTDDGAAIAKTIRALLRAQAA